MAKSEDVLIVALLMVIVVAVAGLFSLQVVGASKHEQVYYVIGYSKYWYAGPFVPAGIPITKVLVSYQVLEISDVDGGLIVDTDDLYYGGHYDFEIGQLYKVYSEGNFWWAHRKITAIELLGDN